MDRTSSDHPESCDCADCRAWLKDFLREQRFDEEIEAQMEDRS